MTAKLKLSDIAEFVTTKISSSNISLEEYVTTDSLLQNKCGRTLATNMPPSPCSLTKYETGDVLIANIRPYLRKIWLADCSGGCSNDVLCFRAKSGHSPQFLYAVLLQDAFYDYVMKGTKGSKMPRGDKRQIMNYAIKPTSNEIEIGSLIVNIKAQIDNLTAINRNLEQVARQLYDYWFVQFDFPNHEGKPYKSSGGEMVYNDLLKREIPKGWGVSNIGKFVDVRKGTTITKAQTKEGCIKVVAAATDYSFMHNESNRKAYVITVSSSGANAGYINFWREPIFASDCSTIQGETIIDTLFAYYWLLHLQDILFSQQIGAAQPHVYPEHISKLPIIIPPNKIKEQLSDFLIVSNKQQHNCEVEIGRLQQLRDELLPMLLNGQVNCDLCYISVMKFY